MDNKMLDRSRACGRYRISTLIGPDAVNIVVIPLEQHRN